MKASLILGFMSAFLFILADINSSGYFHNPVLIVLATLMLAWTGPLTTMAGISLHKEYTWWQPFVGGTQFVLQQAFGWAMFAVSLTLSLVAISWSLSNPKSNFRGGLTGLGILSLTSQLLLYHSLDLFVLEESSGGNAAAAAAVPKISTSSPQPKARTGVSMMIGICSFLLFISADIVNESFAEAGGVLLVVGCGGVVVAICVAHVFNGRIETPGYALWQPFVGGSSFIILQGFGWFLFAVFVDLNLLVARYGRTSLPAGTITALGLVGFAGALLLVLSIKHFQPQRLLVEVPVPSSSPPWNGECWLSFAFALVALATFAVSYRLPTFGPTTPVTQARISMLGMCLSAPLAHIGGKRMWGAHCYRLWQPFAGGSIFVWMQAFGWTLYGVSVMIILLFTLNQRDEWTAVAPLAFSAQMLVLFSVRHFDPTHPTSPRRSQRSSMQRTQQPRWDVEALVAVIMAAAATALFMLVALAIHWEYKFAVEGVHLTAMCAYALAAWVIHCVAGPRRHRSWRLWQPFVGGTQFVIRQSLGWTLFSFMILCALVVVVASIRIALVYIFLGVFSMIAQWLLLSSLAEFEPPVLPPHSLLRLSATLSGWETAQVDSNELHLDVAELLALSNASTRPVVRALLADIISKAKQHPSFQPLDTSTSAHLHGGDRTLVDQALCFVMAFGSLLLSLTAEVIVRLGVHTGVCSIIFALASIASCVASVIIHCIAGPKVHPRWQIIQPFRCGVVFSTLQALGWSLLGLSLFVQMMVMTIGVQHVGHRYAGILSACGSLAFTAQVVLLLSLRHFEGDTSGDSKLPSGGSKLKGGMSIHASPSSSGLHQSSWQSIWIEFCSNKNLWVSLILSFVALVMFVVGDYGSLHLDMQHSMQPFIATATVCFLLSLLFSLFSTNVSIWSLISPHQRVNPLIQSIGLVLWSGSIILGAMMLIGTKLEANCLYSVIGASGFTAQMLITISICSAHKDPTGHPPENSKRSKTKLATTMSRPLAASGGDTVGGLQHLPTDILAQVLIQAKATYIVSRLSISCRTLRYSLASDEFWRYYFVTRWGDQLKVNNSTRISSNAFSQPTSFFFSALELALTVPVSVHSREVTDTTNDNSGTSPLLEADKPDASARLRSRRKKSDWMIASVIKDSGGSVQLLSCSLCNELDVIFDGSDGDRMHAAVHGTSVWVAPCNCNLLIHRECMEKSLADIIGKKCNVCDSHFKTGLRLPMTYKELLMATWQQRDWSFVTLALKWIYYWSICMCIVSLIEATSVHDIDNQNLYNTRFVLNEIKCPSAPIGTFLALQVVMIAMFNTNRFRVATDRLWYSRYNNPLYSFYIRLYLYFVLASITIFFQYVRIPLWRYTWSVLWTDSSLWIFLARSNFLVYITSASSVLYHFWRSNFRVPTAGQHNKLSPTHDSKHCLSCILEISSHLDDPEPVHAVDD